MTEPYYSDELVTLYHGDCREIDAWTRAQTMVTDPPYGIDYRSGARRREGFARAIEGDKDTALRDQALMLWRYRTALMFGSWRVSRPHATKAVLVWDKGGALGMGDLSLPWKIDHEEIHVIGSGFTGRRDSGSVLRFPPEQAVGREHPHQKPLPLMTALIVKTVGTVADPFAGSGSTLVAAKRLGRRAIGVELEERYCEIAAKRLAQGVLDFGAAS